MDPFSPYLTTGLNPGSAPATAAMAGAPPAIHASGGPSAFAHAAAFHPDHPLFWVAGILGVTFGLIAANSAVRVGRFKASVAAGST